MELVVDALELSNHIDHIVLFSGDGDFRSLVEAVQRRGVHVTVVSTISSQPPMIADELPAPGRCLHRPNGIKVQGRPRSVGTPSCARTALAPQNLVETAAVMLSKLISALACSESSLGSGACRRHDLFAAPRWSRLIGICTVMMRSSLLRVGRPNWPTFMVALAVMPPQRCKRDVVKKRSIDCRRGARGGI